MEARPRWMAQSFAVVPPMSSDLGFVLVSLEGCLGDYEVVPNLLQDGSLQHAV